MHEIPLLINIGVALAAALVGGLLARRVRVPPLVGYLVAGMAIAQPSITFSRPLACEDGRKRAAWSVASYER